MGGGGGEGCLLELYDDLTNLKRVSLRRGGKLGSTSKRAVPGNGGEATGCGKPNNTPVKGTTGKAPSTGDESLFLWEHCLYRGQKRKNARDKEKDINKWCR